MRVLVTGEAGLIGFHLCDRLLHEGNEIVALDNVTTGRLENIAHLWGRDDFCFIKHDVSNFIFVPGRVDAVLHFASPASPNPHSPYGFPQRPIQPLKLGALGTHNALVFPRATRARFLLPPTSDAYAHPQHPPPLTPNHRYST